MIDARIRDFDNAVIVPRHAENSKKLDDVLATVNRAKGVMAVIAFLGPIIAALISHFWK